MCETRSFGDWDTNTTEGEKHNKTEQSQMVGSLFTWVTLKRVVYVHGCS
jgi:hypothetical protein